MDWHVLQVFATFFRELLRLSNFRISHIKNEVFCFILLKIDRHHLFWGCSVDVWETSIKWFITMINLSIIPLWAALKAAGLNFMPNLWWTSRCIFFDCQYKFFDRWLGASGTRWVASCFNLLWPPVNFLSYIVGFGHNFPFSEIFNEFKSSGTEKSMESLANISSSRGLIRKCRGAVRRN